MKKTLLFLSFLCIFSIVWAQNKTEQNHNSLVVFLVRHAEKVDNSKNPELSKKGKKRAIHLAQVLINAEIEFIHCSNYIRTKNTALPTATEFGMDIKTYDPENLLDLVKELQKTGGRHLVVGHSNTTPELAKLLGGKPYSEINEKAEYDRLYILTISANGDTTTVLMRYGEKYIPEK